MVNRGRRGGGEAVPYWRRVKQQGTPSKGGSEAGGSWRDAAGAAGGGARGGAAASSGAAAGALPPWRRHQTKTPAAPAPAEPVARAGGAAAAAPAPAPGGSPSWPGRAPLLRGRLVSDPRASWADLADAETSIGSDTEDSNDVEALSRSHSCAAGADSSSEAPAAPCPEAARPGTGACAGAAPAGAAAPRPTESPGACAEEPLALLSVPVQPQCTEAGELPAAQKFQVHGAGFTFDAAAHFGAYGFWPGADFALVAKPEEAEGVADFALVAPRSAEGDGAVERGDLAGEDEYVYAGLVPVWWPVPAAAAGDQAGAVISAAAAAADAGAAGPASAVAPARSGLGPGGEAAEERTAEATGGATSVKQLREEAEEFQPTPLHQAFLRACAAAEEHQQAVSHEQSLGTWCPFWWCAGPVVEDGHAQLGTDVGEQLLACLQGGKLSPLAEGEDSGEDAQGGPETFCDEAAPGSAGA